MAKNKILEIEITQSIFLRYPIVTIKRQTGVHYYNPRTGANHRRVERVLDTYLHTAKIKERGTGLILHISFNESGIS